MAASTDCFSTIDLTWTTIQDAFDDAYQQASPDQKPKVIIVRDMARDAWYAALNKVFHDGDPLIVELTTDLKNDNTRMQADLEGLKQTVQFLDLAKTAAKCAAALASHAV